MARSLITLGLDNVEEFEDHRSGSYPALHLGDTLNEKYQILHKLGSGVFSTTWLACSMSGTLVQVLEVKRGRKTLSCRIINDSTYQ